MNNENYQPISIWDYSTGIFNYSFEVAHELVDNKEDAKEKANYDFDKFGIFINKDLLPNRTLIFGALLKDGTFKHIGKGKVGVKIMKPQTLERLSPSIPIDSEDNKNKVVEALVNMDKSYMVTDDDYMVFLGSLEQIEKTINITPDTPLFFDSIAYRIENSNSRT